MGQPSGSVLDQFMGVNPQFIPGMTGGQADILGRQMQRAFAPTFFTPEEQIARGLSLGFGGLRFPEFSALAGAGQAGLMTSPEAEAATAARGFGGLRFPEFPALAGAGQAGLMTSPEAEAAAAARGFGGLRFPEFSALSRVPSFGAFNTPENMALEQIGQFTQGEIGQSPVTRAAMSTARERVLNDLTMAGLGRSGAVETDLAAAYAPIIAEEIRTRAGVIPQLREMGGQLRGGNIQAAQLESQIAERIRSGDVQGAQALSGIGQAMRGGTLSGAQIQAAIAERMRSGDVQGAQALSGIGQAMRGGTLSGAQIQAAIADRMRAGDMAGANALSSLGQTMVGRESGLLAEAGAGQEFQRQLAAQQAEADRQEYLRRFSLGEGLTLGILGGFPTSTLQRTTATQRGSAGK